MMKLVNKLAETSHKPLSFRRRFLAKALPVFVYSIFFPAILFVIPKFIVDPWLQLPTFLNPAVRLILGGILIIPGSIFLFWSIKAQREIGKGTPMPLMATKKLVVQKPYSYCRNPLFFGLINLFFGISIILGSISSLGMVMVFSAVILLYVKFIEEKELEKRFGDEYLTYKMTTPFLFPFPSLIQENKMKSIFTKIAAVLAFIIGAMAIFSGGQVVLGKVMDYYVIDWLPVYNLVAGLISSLLTAILIWKSSKYALPIAIGTFASHGVVMLILQIAYRDVVAPDSIKAMTIRMVVWLIILILMMIQARKDQK